jgi:hypothetical protein
MRLIRNIPLAAVALALLTAPALARNPTAQERADIEQLAYKYVFALDWRDADAYARAFAPDGVLTYGGGEAVGREQIAAVIKTMRDREMGRLKEGETGQGNGHGKHFISSMVIDVSDDGTRAVAQATWIQINGVEPRIAAHGHYVDKLAKINGEWLYTSRRTINEQSKGRETFPFINPVTNPGHYGAALDEPKPR